MVFLTGAPASGKTTLGRRLAAALGVPFADLDEEIVRKAGRSIPEIFASDGEGAFRDLESQTLAAVVDGASAGVVALGGGTLLRDANRALCERAGTVACLDAPSDEELSRRLGAAPGTRPLGGQAQARAAHYASFPNRVAGWFDLGNSLVVVGRGLARAVLAGRPVAADATVASLWAERLGVRPVATIPSGERHKTIATVASLWTAFARAGLGRKDTVVALGGGVTGDLTGFAAATWMRGIDWINVPTTLLSMVDASTGGKTGCDLPEGKNLAGAFHAPKLVVIDTDFLGTLPPQTLRDGKAEMIKHEVIGGDRGTGNGERGMGTDPKDLGTDPKDLGTDPNRAGSVPNERLPKAAEIVRNLAVKVGIVRDDPFETKGRRLLLNCGHTVGHAIEKATDYAVSHGEAVAIGCVEEAKIAARRGLSPATWPEELAARFAEAGLPTKMEVGKWKSGEVEEWKSGEVEEWKSGDVEKLVPLMKGDKKRAGSVVTFALPCGWGDVRAVPIDLDKETL